MLKSAHLLNTFALLSFIGLCHANENPIFVSSGVDQNLPVDVLVNSSADGLCCDVKSCEVHLENEDVLICTGGAPSTSCSIDFGVKSYFNQDLNLSTELGQIEVERHEVSLLGTYHGSIAGCGIRPSLHLSWSSLELEYAQGQGTLEMKPSLVYGFGVGVDLYEWNDWKSCLRASWKKGDFNGDTFNDRLNLRSGIPFKANIEFENYEIGVVLERTLKTKSLDVDLGFSVLYSELHLDMDTGWFVNTPARMKSEDHFGGEWFVTPLILGSMSPTLTLRAGDVLSVGLSVNWTLD